MYAAMGSTGKVGASVTRRLLTKRESVLIPVRDVGRAQALVRRGAQAIRADYEAVGELSAALRLAPAGAFVMLPPLFDPAPGFPEARARIEVLHAALLEARPARIVALSTIGADAPQPNLLNQLRLLEERLSTLPVPVALLRAAWFMDNAAADLEAARATGLIDSYLQPLDRPIAMVAACDVGVAAADLLTETWSGVRVIELEGPTRVAPLDVAAAFAQALHRPVRAVAKPRSTWRETFVGQGMQYPESRMQMLDGFNTGWIRFAEDGACTRRGTTTLRKVVSDLVAGAGGSGD